MARTPLEGMEFVRPFKSVKTKLNPTSRGLPAATTREPLLSVMTYWLAQPVSSIAPNKIAGTNSFMADRVVVFCFVVT